MNELDHFRRSSNVLAEHLTAELQRAGRLEAGGHAERPVAEAWLQISIGRAGRFPWPTEWGGTDWSAEQHAIWQQELTLASAPSIPLMESNGGPGTMHYATDAQSPILTTHPARHRLVGSRVFRARSRL